MYRNTHYLRYVPKEDIRRAFIQKSAGIYSLILAICGDVGVSIDHKDMRGAEVILSPVISARGGNTQRANDTCAIVTNNNGHPLRRALTINTGAVCVFFVFLLLPGRYLDAC